MSIPDQPDNSQDESGVSHVAKIRHLNPYRETAIKYYKSGWFGVLPLPHKQKYPPPTGFTGHAATYPNLDQLKEWASDGTQHNIGLRLAGVDKDHEIIGIDVDHYTKGGKEKVGGDQLKALEDLLGALPETWVSSSRTDGVSGIRYFRVPRGLAYRGQVDKDIECISKGYRFAVVWPSVHPSGETYWWFPPGIIPDEKARCAWRADHKLPRATDLPLLPEAWLDYLQSPSSADQRIDSDSGVEEIWAWCDETLHGDDDTEMCKTMADKVKKHVESIRNEATSHDKLINGHYNIAKLSLEGHRGWVKAVNEVEHVWVDEVIQRDKRGRDEVVGEVWRSRINAFRKIKAQSDDRVKLGSSPVDIRCDESGMCELPATVDSEAFWKSSPQLADLRQFAQARLVGPWAMLGATLARVVAAIPPHVVLPPTVGSYASLNLFVALVGKSGESKSASMLASADWLTVEPDFHAMKPGSGEGLAKCFAYKTKLPNGGGWSQVGKQWSVLAQLPEVDTLTATGSRGGATIMSSLREGWSGERLGQDYAGEDKQVVLSPHRYRLCLVVGVQPLRAAPLFDDADGGTPQRFVWFTAIDDDMPDVEPSEPPKLDLGRWEPHTKTFPLSIDATRNGQLHERIDPADFHILGVPGSVSDEIKATQRAIRKGNVDPLDGHRLLVQLKIAAALMALEGRKRDITEHDWRRAATVMEMSDHTRKNVAEELTRRKSEMNASRGRFEGERADIADQIKTSRAVERVADKIANYLEKQGDPMARSDVRKKFNSRDRIYFDEAEMYLIEKRRIAKDEAANNGPDGFVLRLLEGGVSK
ncbi:hypothetical protein DAVIS_04693 [Mycobacterium marinum]|uniref:DNA primase/polymerase bifunctional N-terminal domain-containing protein n=1 Tax=Mycobacterium marinum TaxID=1781 RepID=A0A3E2MQV2_MYCMR|nr:bifunctional DNA primase/polymerase [Mycobacterium marinum]RFZ35143.1 hypothetical protein DAVIS_04693 [Mycobacterium marinum]